MDTRYCITPTFNPSNTNWQPFRVTQLNFINTSTPHRLGITLAERGGFEPPKGLTPCRFSRPVHSTALPPLLKHGRLTVQTIITAVLSRPTCFVPRANIRNRSGFFCKFTTTSRVKEYPIESYSQRCRQTQVEISNFAIIIKDRTFLIR